MDDQATTTKWQDPYGRSAEGDAERKFLHRTLVVVGIVVAVAALLGLVWCAADVLLLVFGGVLVAVLLRGLSDPLSRYTGIPAGWALALVVLVLVALFGLGGWRVAGIAANQFDQLVESLPHAQQRLEQYLNDYAWGQKLLEQQPSERPPVLRRTDILARATGLFSTALGLITSAVIVVFAGVYLAATPGVYRRGLVRLFPLSKRRRANEVCDAIGATLRWWLLGRLLSMTVVSVATTIGLWLLGIPAALVLGLITFLLVFIPYLGPILAAAPAVLFSLSMPEPMTPAYVALLYLGIQSLEGYLLTPLVQARAVHLPPVVTLTAQVLMGVLLGLPGIVLATPVVAVAIILIKMLYVEDTLGDSFDHPGTVAQGERRTNEKSRSFKQ